MKTIFLILLVIFVTTGADTVKEEIERPGRIVHGRDAKEGEIKRGGFNTAGAEVPWDGCRGYSLPIERT